MTETTITAGWRLEVGGERPGFAGYPRITLTGADERVPIAALKDLCRRRPTLEIGLLYTETPEGRNRYPSKEWLQEAVRALRGQCAVHVCGGTARRMVVEGEARWAFGAGRMQLNGFVPLEHLYICSEVLPVIVQIPANQGLLGLDFSGRTSRRPQALVDASGGRGIPAGEWVRPETSWPVGFAGGLGPENLAEELTRIYRVAQAPWWVDMEGRLRDEGDWFSLEKAEECCRLFDNFLLDPPE